jgi:O-acetyl-ADP-ribose deacetylase (regulator of RNase III)
VTFVVNVLHCVCVRERIELFRGDVTTLAADAIVNAANSQLSPEGRSVSIHRAAGPELEAECMSLRRGVHAGDAVITRAYRLQAKYVIHAVGASWHGGKRRESEELASVYRRCFALAKEYGLRTIAFPAISCGLYSFPARQAAEIAIGGTAAALESMLSLERVTFALFTDEVWEAFDEALRALGNNADQREDGRA